MKDRAIRANAIKCRKPYSSDLLTSPNGLVSVGLIAPGDFMLPAGLPDQVDEDGNEWMALIVWVRHDDVMRCGADE